jgi:hypothetical protein
VGCAARSLHCVHGNVDSYPMERRHTDVAGALYIMSPCCMSPMGGGISGNQASERFAVMVKRMEKSVADVKSPAEAAALPGAVTQLAVAAAWAPNPDNSPLYRGLPPEKWRRMRRRLLSTSTSEI